MTSDEDMLRELRRISKILLFSNSKIVELEIAKVATTDERKRMWVLMDGDRMPKDIAEATGVTQMAVSNFLNEALTAELIEYQRGNPPKRLLNYVPPVWIGLLPSEKDKPAKIAGSERLQANLEPGKDGGSDWHAGSHQRQRREKHD